MYVNRNVMIRSLLEWYLGRKIDVKKLVVRDRIKKVNRIFLVICSISWLGVKVGMG